MELLKFKPVNVITEVSYKSRFRVVIDVVDVPAKRGKDSAYKLYTITNNIMDVDTEDNILFDDSISVKEYELRQNVAGDGPVINTCALSQLTKGLKRFLTNSIDEGREQGRKFQEFSLKIFMRNLDTDISLVKLDLIKDLNALSREALQAVQNIDSRSLLPEYMNRINLINANLAKLSILRKQEDTLKPILLDEHVGLLTKDTNV